MKRVLHELAALLSGVLFGAGLVIGGMTKPQKILGFLDLFGVWDGSLMFVMIAAIAVHALAYRFIRGRASPLFAEKFAIPSRRDLDLKLLLGAAIFGVGWGLGGYCPGPSLVSLPAGGVAAAVFAAAMLTGMFVTAKLEQRVGRVLREPRRSAAVTSAPPSHVRARADDRSASDPSAC